ncbi:MAG: uracil phosphoribosyltransferase [Zetaproteobacteria bacterium]|nr:uracil phosphoribosyltransferase [Pseudobdellovibrionaceae bacterium]
MSKITIVEHPLIKHKLSIMRNKDTSCTKFRTLMNEISTLLAYEVTRDLELVEKEIETPMTTMVAPFLKESQVALISILRAGNGLLTGILNLLPSAKVGHIGLYREPETLVAIEYYFKMPNDISSRKALVVDPMLATGHSACAAIFALKKAKPKSITFVSLLASPEGIKEVQEQHPDVNIFTASIDEKIDEHGYIIPGLGDAGDRIYGTE